MIGLDGQLNGSVIGQDGYPNACVIGWTDVSVDTPSCCEGRERGTLSTLSLERSIDARFLGTSRSHVLPEWPTVAKR